MRKNFVLSIVCIFVFSFLITAKANAGRIVIDNDEWTLWDSGFSGPNDPGQFVTNVASFFSGGTPGGTFANASGILGSQAIATLTSAGYTVENVSTSGLTLAQLQAYKGLFLGGGGGYPSSSMLTDYVNGGGNVYIAGGTGAGGDWQWNPFLNNFGLQLANSYNGIEGSMSIVSANPIFNGVDHLYQYSGQTVSPYGSNPNAQVLINGLYGVYTSPAPVPIPGALLLFGPGLAGLAALRQRFTI